MRRHGSGAIYASGYPQSALRDIAQRILDWSSQGKEVFIYFNNDAHGYAVKNALSLKALLSQGE
jgi:uncharacterized protein YecE (DUF72 family)